MAGDLKKEKFAAINHLLWSHKRPRYSYRYSPLRPSLPSVLLLCAHGGEMCVDLQGAKYLLEKSVLFDVRCVTSAKLDRLF